MTSARSLRPSTTTIVPTLVAILGTIVVSAALTFVGTAPAQAHARLLRTNPASGASLPVAPVEVVLTFDEPPLALGARVEVTGPGGVASTGDPRIVDATVHQTLRPGIPSGLYHVAWRVTSDDGHPVSDIFTFTVNGSTPAQSSPTATTTPTTPTTPTTTPIAAAGSQQQSRGVSAPLLWGIAAAVLVIMAAAVAAARTRRSPQEKP